MRMFISIDEISDEDLGMICFNSFEKGFLLKDSDLKSDDESIIPVVRVGDKTFVAELFHGPTFCFKDFGMRAVVNILSHFATKRNKHITLLVSTTGDTGPAAVQAVSDAANPLLNLLVHYPDGQISSLQRRQLTTVQSPNVHVVAFQGGGDDMDAPIKNILSSSRNEKDATLSGSQNDYTEHLLCGINSYNIGRPLFQMVHFVS
jgi:threonine synthase